MSKYANYPSLESKTVFITGGATGIGAAMVEEFSKQGAVVCFVDSAENEAEKLCLRLNSQVKYSPIYYSLDVTNIDDLKNCISTFAGSQGSIDILINNVGDDARHSPLDITLDDWRACMAVNLDATFFACQAGIPFMQKNKKGTIINLSSINVFIGPEQMPGYVAAKSALNGLGKSLANQYGKDGIRVNTILPGWVATEKQLNKYMSDDAFQEWQKTVAIKAKIKPIHIVNLALFLASDDSEMITGQQFVIDGGKT